MKKERNVVFVLPIYLPAKLTGSEMIIRDLSESLAKLGQKATIITGDVKSARGWYLPYYGEKLVNKSLINNVNVVRLSCRPLYSLCLFILNKIFHLTTRWTYIKKIIDTVEILSWGPYFIDLERTIAQIRPDIIVVSPFPAGICLTVSVICKKLHIPYVVIPFFKKDQRLFENKLLSQILNEASLIFTPTHTEETYIKDYTSNTNIRLLPSSVDLLYIKKNANKIHKKAQKLRNESRFKGKKIVLFVGNKGIGKGILDAAQACRMIGDPTVVFVTVGSSTKDWDMYRKRYPSSIVDITYQDGVSKYAYFELADVCILPSVTDNFPIVFLEAWAYKKPVLAYDYYSMKEILKDGSGFLAKPKDIVDLSKTLADILQNEKKRLRAGFVGYNKVQAYSRNAIVSQYFLPELEKIQTYDK